MSLQAILKDSCSMCSCSFGVSVGGGSSYSAILIQNSPQMIFGYVCMCGVIHWGWKDTYHISTFFLKLLCKQLNITNIY